MTLISETAENAVSFVSRTEKNLGVVAYVEEMPSVPVLPEGFITVALGGSVLAAFVQNRPFYTAQNIAVLSPKRPMTVGEKIYYCICIGKNKFKYSTFGREAKRSLRYLDVPVDCPEWAKELDAVQSNYVVSNPVINRSITLNHEKWEWFEIGNLFDIRKGKRLTKANQRPGLTPFIGAIDNDNGLSAFIDESPLHPANVITIVYNGNGLSKPFIRRNHFGHRMM